MFEESQEIESEDPGQIAAVIAAAGLTLSQSLDLQDILDELLRCLSLLIPFDSANVMLLVDEQHLAVRSHRGYERWTDPKLLEAVRFDATQNATFSQIFQTHKSLLVPDTRNYPGWDRSPGTEHVNSWLGVPLLLQGKLLGVYSVEKNAAGFFNVRHVRLAESLLGHAARAINNAKTYNALEGEASELKRQIAQREQAERELAQREELLRSIIASEPDCVKLLDREGRLLSMNPAGLAMIEAESLEQVHGQRMADLVMPGYAVDFECLTECVFRGESGKLEFEIRGFKGAQRWLETRALPMRDPDGKVTRLLGITRDITERQQADAIQRSNDEFVRDILDNLTALVGLFTPEGIILEVNKPPLLLAGLKREDVIGKELADTYWWNYAPEVQAQIRDVFRRVAKGETVTGDFRPRMADGVIVDICATYAPLRGATGNVTKVIGSGFDITQRRSGEEALRQSEDRFHKAFLASPESMAIATQENGSLVEVNEAFLRLTGYDRAEMIGKTTFDLNIWREAVDRDRFLKMLVVSGRANRFAAAFHTKGGERRNVEISAELVQLDGKNCVLSIIRDVTEQQKLMEQLRMAQKMEAVGRLAGGVAHDFNNLLTVISGYSELLMDETAGDAGIQRKVEQIMMAAQKAAGVTAQLLAFGRQQILMPTVLDLNAVVMDINRLLPQVVRANIELTVRLSKGMATVRADKTQLEQVIINLVANARDAMPGGGRLVIETTCTEVGENIGNEHYEIPQGRYVMLAVSDNGTGMDKETQSRIFEPFFTTKESSRGTGLGLATVYGIVKQSDGFIYVYSEPGMGTTFKVYLRAVDEPLPTGPVAKGIPQRLEGTEMVLIVDDEDALRAVIAEYLGGLGYAVLSASNGVEGLELARQNQECLAVVVTDVVMPSMGGQELALRIRDFSSKIKVILVSGYTDDRISPAGQLANDFFFLQKPYRLQELAAKIRSLIDPLPSSADVAGSKWSIH